MNVCGIARRSADESAVTRSRRSTFDARALVTSWSSSRWSRSAGTSEGTPERSDAAPSLFGVALNCCSVFSIVDPLLTAGSSRTPFSVREPRANRINEGCLRERFTKECERSGGERLPLRDRIVVRADEDHRELALRGQE